jgi:hypothetical protein
MTPDDYDIMKADMLDEDTALQLENIKTLLLALDKDDRDVSEAYIAGLVERKNNISCPRGECKIATVKGKTTCLTCGHVG